MQRTYVLGVAWHVSQRINGTDGDEVGLQLLGSNLSDGVGRVL